MKRFSSGGCYADITPKERAKANGQRSFVSFLLLQLSNSFLKILSVPNKAVFCNSPVLIVTPSFSSHASYLLLTTSSAPTTTGTTSRCLIPHSLPISLLRSWYFSIFSYSSPYTLWSQGEAMSTMIALLCYFPSQQQQEQALILYYFLCYAALYTYQSTFVRKHHTYKGHTKFTKSSRWAGIRTFPVSTKSYSWIQERSKPSCKLPRFTHFCSSTQHFVYLLRTIQPISKYDVSQVPTSPAVCIFKDGGWTRCVMINLSLCIPLMNKWSVGIRKTGN